MESEANKDEMLRVENLTRRYGDLTAVDGLSFAVRRGEVFGFLGPNGAGKTTTIKMMCGLLRPHGGTIEIAGRAMRGRDWKVLRRIGVCPQSIVVWETMTCREQLEFMGRVYDLNRRRAAKRAAELLETFGLAEKRNKLARTLSGGMQRRLNIALALVHEPEILFLDEPQAGLDPQSRVLVREYVKGLAGAMTVILTTHDMEEAEKMSDRVCIIDHGRLLALDSVAGITSRLGPGDLFEIRIAEDIRQQLLPRLSGLEGVRERFTVQGNVLRLVSEAAADLLPPILQRIREAGLHLIDLRVRQATLEDVFIGLTGRGLRE
ncbi:MAG: ABC transporter ATP-binding protein [Candidatus Aminicenantes bacterium]|nr:ABC transporter ATP-binding protein [Candidatus Aminicenantes bacterium]